MSIAEWVSDPEKVAVAAPSFAAGCVLTYGFIMRTVVKAAKDEIGDLRADVKALRAEVGILQDARIQDLKERNT